jgi:DNA-binding transcriptional LysR family regulator
MYPACSVELRLSDTKVDLIADHFDLSIRVGWLDDSSYQARRVGSFRQLLVAAPDLAQTWNSAEPEDLTGLPFIANASLKEPLVWRFTKGDFDPRTVRLRQTILTNSTPAAMAAALAGGGMSVLPDFLAAEHLEAGRLSQLLPAWDLPAGGVYVVYPAARFRPPKVTAFVAMLSQSR